MNNPEKCDKRQKEVKGGNTQHRCVDKKALDTYLQIVDAPTCEGCPLLAAKLSRGGCDGVSNPQPAHWSQELLSVKTVGEGNLLKAEQEQGYEQPCRYRFSGECQITGLGITPEICKACDQETADHMATLPEMAVGFATEVKQWIREGRPVRTDEEVAERLAICKGGNGKPACKLYDPAKEACKKCGCGTSESSWALRNGIRMKTKICPMGLWR